MPPETRPHRFVAFRGRVSDGTNYIATISIFSFYKKSRYLQHKPAPTFQNLANAKTISFSSHFPIVADTQHQN